MHKRVEEILEKSDKLCIQYIFSSFSEELDISNKFLSAIYFSKNDLDKKIIFGDWFERGKNKKEEFFKTYPIDTESELVTNEFEKHQAWKDKTGLRATPTILVNGYKLPDNYKIEDLRFFSEVNI
jgi:hypothetical protein